MSRQVPPILPRLSRLVAGVGENLKKARLRRAFSAETVSQRAGITRKTLHRVEQGDPAVAMGIYARVLQALRLENDLAAIALDDALGRKLQDANLGPNRRAPRRSAATNSPSDVPNPTRVHKHSKDLQ